MALYQVLGKDLEKGAVAKRRANRMSVTIASLLISGGKTTVSESPMNSAANSQSSPARESPVVPRQLPCNTPSIHLSKMKTPKTSTPRSPASQCAPHSNLPVITQVSPHLLSQPIADGHEEDESPIMSSAPRPISIMEAGPNVSAADSVLTCGTQHEDHPEQESAHSDASAFQFTAPSQKKPRRTMRSSQRTVSKRTKDTSDDALLKQAPCPKASTTAAKEKAGNWGNQPKSCSPFGFPKDDALLPEPKPVSRVKRLESKRGRKPRRAAGSTKRTAGNKVNDKKDPKRVTAAGDDAGDDAVPTTPSDAYSSLHEPSKKPDRRPHAKQEKRRAVLDDVHFPGDVPSSTDNAESPPLLPSPTPIDSRGHVSEREAKTFNPSTKAGRKQGNSKAQSAEAHFPADSPTITDNEESPPLLQSPNMLDFKIRPSVKSPDQCMKDGRRKCHDERRKPQSSTISPTSHFPKPASQREVRTPPQSTPPQASQRMLTPCSVRLDRVSFSSRSPADVPTAIAKLQLKASSILEDFSASMLDVMAPVDPANAFRQEEPAQVNSEVGGAKGRGRHRKKKEQDRLDDSPLLLTAAMPLDCVSSAPQPDSENAWTAPNTPKCDRSDLSDGSGSDFDSFNHAKPPSEPQPRQPRSNRATRDSGVGHSSYNLSPHVVKGKSPSGSSKRNNTPRLMFEMTPVTSTRKKRGRREMDYTSNDDDRQQAKRRKPDRSIAQDIPEASNDLGVHTTHNLSVAPDEVVDHNTAADFLGTNSLSGSSSHLSFGRTPIQGNDIQSLLQGFGSCVSDSFKSKQRAMAGFTHSLSNYTANLVDDMWNANCHEREQALSSFNESVSPRLLALEKTFLVQQNMQDKMMATMKECIASLQSTRQAQHENLSGIKNNVLTYVKKMDTLATRQSDRKALLQRSLLTKSQQEQERMQQHITKMQVEQIRKTLRATVMQV